MKISSCEQGDTQVAIFTHVLVYNLKNLRQLIHLAMTEWGWVGYEELCRSRRVLLAVVDNMNTLRDLQNSSYYPFKIFPRLWWAKSTLIIYHNQPLMTKFGGILRLTNRWCQKCRFLALNAVKSTWNLCLNLYGRSIKIQTSVICFHKSFPETVYEKSTHSLFNNGQSKHRLVTLKKTFDKFADSLNYIT